MTRPSRSRAKRLGRRLGTLALATFVGVPTAIWSIQIMKAVWSPPPGPPPASCAAGMSGLLQALDRARSAARLSNSGERKNLAEFRAGLVPEWDSRAALGPLCEHEPRLQHLLKDIDALRYAEEHAIRYEAGALAGQRWRARELERELELETGSGAAPLTPSPENH